MKKRHSKPLRLTAGDKALRPNDPVIEIIGTGNSAYLWVGNNGETDKRCFAVTRSDYALTEICRRINRARKKKVITPTPGATK